MHEVIFSHKNQSRKGVHTLDIAKRLIDYGFHPMTIYFPLIVEGAMLIEPTESVGRADLDAFIEAMQDIAREAGKIRNSLSTRRTRPASAVSTKPPPPENRYFGGSQIRGDREVRVNGSNAAVTAALRFCGETPWCVPRDFSLKSRGFRLYCPRIAE